MIDMKNGSFYRTASGAVTGRVSKGDTGFEAVVDGKVRIFDAAGGAVHGGDDIVEEWVPKVGERVRSVRDSTAGGARFGRKGDTATVAGDVREGDAAVDVKVDGSSIGFNPGAYLSDLEPLPVAAPAQPADSLKIEAGRYYRTRDGRKVGPMESDNWGDGYPWTDGDRWYSSSGAWVHDEESEHDLIAEWQDEPTAPVAAQVDTLAEEYGPARAATTSDDDDIVEMSIGELTMAIADALRVVGKKTAKKPVKIGDAVTLSAPARIAGIDKKNAMVVLDTGGSFALPLAALRAA